MSVLVVLSLAGLAIALVHLLVCELNLRRYRAAPEVDHAPGSGAAPGEAPEVSVCVPARNEQDNIEACVRSLLASRGVGVEVLVYNDQSTDRTGEIVAALSAQDCRVRAVPTEPLPAGWVGKQWGCDRMARSARGRWLLFTDADVRFESDCLARTLMQAQRAKADLLSTFPMQVCRTIGESMLVPIIHFILFCYLPMGRMRRTNDPAASAACGQFLFVRREAYDASGGHAAFQSSMHDGIRMPRAVRRAGFRTDLFDGTALVSCRMYRGFGQAWRGFAKNAYEGLGSIALLVVLTVLNTMGHVLPWAVLLGAVAGSVEDPRAILPSAAAVCAGAFIRLRLAQRFDQPLLGVFLHPVTVLLMTLIQWHSLVLFKTGQRAWRGRVTA